MRIYATGVLPIRSWEARQKIGEIAELLIADRVEHFRHRWVVAASRIVLVLAQRFHEIVLTLSSQPRYLLGAGKIRVMAEITPVLLDEPTRLFEPSWITGVFGWTWRW
jgi:hypothetical protein